MSRSLEKIGQQLFSAVVVLFGLYVVAKIYVAGQFMLALACLAVLSTLLILFVPSTPKAAFAEPTSNLPVAPAKLTAKPSSPSLRRVSMRSRVCPNIEAGLLMWAAGKIKVIEAGWMGASAL